MGRTKGSAASIDAVRQRIEHWRETRAKRSPMPKELWDAAVGVAREHGLWAVSRALRLNYDNLKKRVDGALSADAGAGVVESASFVELTGAQLIGCGRAAIVLELSDADGSKLTIRVEGREALDMQALADAFWRRGR
jgi:hypothetical protein